MPKMPRTAAPDASLALLSDGYAFIDERCRRYGTDVFRTRLLLEPAICMRGREAAELFYDRERFTRAGAAPRQLRMTLFGTGGVQTLDGEAHRRRKAMFLSVLSPEGVARLAEGAAARWGDAAARWEGKGEVVLFHEAMEVLCRAVCDWAGVPLPEAEVRLRTGDMAAMIDAPASVGYRYLRGRLGRERSERWIGDLVERVRSGALTAPAGSALAVVASHRDADGAPLDRHEAAVELINVLRPTIAVARYVVFAALALHEHPGSREALRTGGREAVRAFVQEVRRYYPFFPFIAARVRHDFVWRGYRFPEGTRVLLDLYGTDHDERLWEEPEAFRPERFLGREVGPFELIPQGGGDPHAGHRCAGEWTTIALMEGALDLLTRKLTYDVPEQDLRIDLSRVPAIPASRFVIRGVQRAA